MQQEIENETNIAEEVELVGLHRKSRLCKICNVFSDNILNEFTLDILLRRRTYLDMCDHYTTLLPSGIAKVSQTNINNHRKHCDPALIAEEYLAKAGIPIRAADKITKLYSMRYAEVITKSDMLQEIYKERVSNLLVLQELLDVKKAEYEKISPDSTSVMVKGNRIKLQREMKNLVLSIDDIQNKLQQVLVRDIGNENGGGTSTINVYNNVVNVFQGGLKDFMGELVPYLLLNIFPNDVDKGKEVVRHISTLMDEKLGPALIAEESESDKVDKLIKQRKS